MASVNNLILSMPAAVQEYFRQTGAVGGRKRAATYSKAQLREWGKLGGRPRKDGSRSGQATSSSQPSAKPQGSDC